MVFDYDHSDNYYSPLKTETGLNRHRRSFHVSHALHRVTEGEAKTSLRDLKQTFTNFRHIPGCPVDDTDKFTRLHDERRSTNESLQE
jgi:hypothetical protein